MEEKNLKSDSKECSNTELNSVYTPKRKMESTSENAVFFLSSHLKFSFLSCGREEMVSCKREEKNYLEHEGSKH